MDAPDTTYNGWTNYETWNVALWVDNDEASYHLRRAYGLTDADSLKEFLYQIWPTGFTPDGADFDNANLDEILEAWEEE